MMLRKYKQFIIGFCSGIVFCLLLSILFTLISHILIATGPEAPNEWRDNPPTLKEVLDYRGTQ